jgi:hypothetical protein
VLLGTSVQAYWPCACSGQRAWAEPVEEQWQPRDRRDKDTKQGRDRGFGRRYLMRLRFSRSIVGTPCLVSNARGVPKGVGIVFTSRPNAGRERHRPWRSVRPQAQTNCACTGAYGLRCRFDHYRGGERSRAQQDVRADIRVAWRCLGDGLHRSLSTGHAEEGNPLEADVHRQEPDEAGHSIAPARGQRWAPAGGATQAAARVSGAARGARGLRRASHAAPT